MLKLILAALLLSLTFTSHAKPIGIAAISEDTSFVLTDEPCPPGGPIANFHRKFILIKGKENLTGCYGVLMIHPELPPLVILYITDEKAIIFLPATSFQNIESSEVST
jgi:hypothetical protein